MLFAYDKIFNGVLKKTTREIEQKRPRLSKYFAAFVFKRFLFRTLFLNFYFL